MMLAEVAHAAFLDELEKIAAKIKSNDPMPPRTKVNVSAMETKVRTWESPHQEAAVAFMDKVGPSNLFDVLHSARRWYSGGTRAHNIAGHHSILSQVMKLEPKDVLGVFRGFKVDKKDPLAQLKPGEQITIPVSRNKGISSWSTSQAATNKFSGGGKGKVGIIVKLIEEKGIKPILAPPAHTEPWFNELYAHVIGKSWRPTESEYLIEAPSFKAEVVKVKK